MYPILTLKSGKEDNLYFKHPWIFSGALSGIPKDIEHGSLVHIADTKGNILGTGTFSGTSMFAVRIFDFSKAKIDYNWIKNKIFYADSKRLIKGPGLTGYRVVFGETDMLPGLIIDRYMDVFVIQISTAGMNNLKDFVIKAIKELFSPKAIYERSDLPSRKDEGLEEFSGELFGKVEEPVEFKEFGIPLYSYPITGQKTGYFLDQKDLRKEIQKYSSDKKILNLFSYSGASGIYAMKAGAKSVHNVDSSKPALKMCEEHAKLNKIKASNFTIEQADIFKYFPLEDKPEYDMVILDPPALIKSKADTEAGKKAYHYLNRGALRLIKNNGIFITSSCSHFLTEEDFTFILRRVSIQTKVELSIIKIVRQSSDHPLSIYFPESSYLKTFIAIVKK